MAVGTGPFHFPASITPAERRTPQAGKKWCLAPTLPEGVEFSASHLYGRSPRGWHDVAFRTDLPPPDQLRNENLSQLGSSTFMTRSK